VVRIGGAEAVGTATALADGAPGERITVRRAADASTLLATVSGPGEVEIRR
jgi:flagella basal body P-ring formation protein FlgA